MRERPGPEIGRCHSHVPKPTPTAALLSCHQAPNAALVECPVTLVITVTLPILPCLGEAKRSPYSPLTLQGNDGFPFCVPQATQWIPHSQPRGWGFCPGPQAHALSSGSQQILTPFYLPTPPHVTCVPSAGLHPHSCHPTVGQGCGQGSSVISPAPTVP